MFTEFPIPTASAQDHAAALLEAIGAASATEVSGRDGRLENVRGLLAAFGGFMELEVGTQETPAYLGITGFGDSMASGAYVMGMLYQELSERFGCGAWVSSNLGGIAGNGNAWTFGGGAAIPPTDYTHTPGSNWIVMPTGSTASYTLPDTATAAQRSSNANNAAFVNGVRSRLPLSGGTRKVSIYYVKEPGAGSITATLSQSQVTDQVTGPVSCDASSGMGKIEFTPTDRVRPITVSLVASVAQVRVIGIVFWGDSGVVCWSSQQGGSTMTQQLPCLSDGAFKAAYAEFFAELNTRLVVHAQRAPGDANWQANYPIFFAAYAALNDGRVSQLVLGEPPQSTVGSPTIETINTFLRAECRSRGLAFIDQTAVLGDYAALNTLGWDVNVMPSTVDGTHLGGRFYRFMAGYVLAECHYFQSALSINAPGASLSRLVSRRNELGMLEEVITRRLRFATGFVPDGQAVTGGFAVNVSNEKGVFLSSAAELGSAVCRLGVLSGGSGSGSRATLPTGSYEVAIAAKGIRNVNVPSGCRAWFLCGVHTTAITSVAAVAERCFGLEFAWGPDVGSPEGADTEVCRLVIHDGTSLLYSAWHDTAPPGSGSTPITGFGWLLRWNPATRTLFLYAAQQTPASEVRSLRPVLSLTAPLLISNTNGAWLNVGIHAGNGANVPSVGGEFGIQEVSARIGEFAAPYLRIQ